MSEEIKGGNVYVPDLYHLCVPPAEWNPNLCPAGSWKCVFPSFIVQLGLQQYCFLVFLVICSLTATYIFFIIPETKNKTFLEIQNEFRSSRKSNSCHTDGVSTTLISTSMWLCIVSGPGLEFLYLFHNHECIQQVSHCHMKENTTMMDDENQINQNYFFQSCILIIVSLFPPTKFFYLLVFTSLFSNNSCWPI